MGDRTQMSNLKTVGILGGEAQAGSAGDVPKFHGDGGIAAEAANNCLLNGDVF